MFEFNVSRAVSAGEEVTAALLDVRAKLIGLIVTRAHETLDRYADLRSQVRTRAATDLIWQVYKGITGHERASGKRVRGRRARSGVKLEDAIARFVGDLLRARTGTNTTGRMYRPTGKSDFSDAPVKYDMFMKALDGLKALGLVEHRKGRTRSRDTGFGFRVTVPGRASRFWATPKLVKFAKEHGIHSGNVGDHFFPEPPTNPLVLRDYASGRGQNKERGRIIKYQRTPETDKLERDIKELNDFLARFKITGGKHEGYHRTFNNASWDKGGRLHSVGEGNYQQLSEHKRLEMTINDEPVAEIDIKASHLTIYHAMVGEPLGGREDPYARAGTDRDVAKLWCTASFGNSAPKRKWSAEMVKAYQKKTGQDLRKVAKASEVAKAMLSAFPALQKLKEHPHIWADLQFKEAETVIRTMLILKRRHGVPSLSMHDGLIVPRFKADLAKNILASEYCRTVGVEPMLTVEPEDPYDAALYL
jgi:hypothetical protein